MINLKKFKIFDFFLCKITIDSRKWFYLIKNGEIKDIWFCESELTRKEMQGDIIFDGQDNYRFVSRISPKIKLEWHPKLVKHRFKIGILIGILLTL